MKKNSNTKNPKNQTAHGSHALTPFERLGMRRPDPLAADIWWSRLHPMEKSFFYWFVRATQIATETEALQAVATFRGIDNTMLLYVRKERARRLRHQQRLARARNAEKPQDMSLAA
jgi:hypothetical protein